MRLSIYSAFLVLKPGIALGVAVAGLAGAALAGHGFPEPARAALAVLCIVMAASGSAGLNVVLESGTDAFMSRLSRRSVALAALGGRRAAALSSALIMASLAISYVYINTVAALLILAASVSYAVLYTLCLKRRTPFGTVLGGIPGALPVLIGYASVDPALGLDGLILFLVMLMWQPPHFLALALKYGEDYRAAGLPAMPATLGEEYTKAFMFVYATAITPLVVSLWLFGYCSAGFAAAAAALGFVYLAVSWYDVFRSGRYGRAFGLSIVYIMLLLASVVLDTALS
ncbi:MAG: UbiA family prenyltransferase [Nitrospirae bacterium]|nr:UbiA family prenyltransferase [Nitrospirota bacterium]